MRIHPYIKIVCVALVCIQIAFLHHILFTSYFPDHVIRSKDYFKVGAVIYFLTVYFFGQHYFRRRQYLKLAVWLILNSSLITNTAIWVSGEYPPIYIQYSQSTSLLVYASLMLFSKNPKPNWERIFAISCLIILIPCLFFYFQKDWEKYEILIYILSFTPLINSLIFTQEIQVEQEDILDLD